MTLRHTFTHGGTKLRALLVVAALAVTLVTTTAASAGGPGEPGARQGEEHGREFQSLEEAIAAGNLDAELVDGLAREGSVEAIVTFDSTAILDEAEQAAPAGPERAKAIIDAARENFAQQKGRALGGHGTDSELIRDYENLPTSFVRFRSKGALLAVLNSSDVSGVRANRTGSPALQQSLLLVRVNGKDGKRLMSATGAGTYVAVIDTGVDYRRAAFGSCTAPNVPSTCKVFKAVPHATTSNCEVVAPDGGPGDELHGTNVAGIVVGVAPGTKIFDFDVFHAENGGCYYDDDAVLDAISWAVYYKKAGYDIRALNMSLGYRESRFDTCPWSMYTGPFDEARRVGILPVVASGNDGFTDGIEYPACTPGAVSVGAVYDDPCAEGAAGACLTSWAIEGYTPSPSCENALPWDQPILTTDTVTCFSNSGESLSIFAPGWLITAAGIYMGGTSQAAPHVAGAVAVLASGRPTATGDAIQHALINNGPIITDDRDGDGNAANDVKRRRLDVYAALSSLVNRPADTTAPVVTEPIHAIPEDFQIQATSSTIPVTISWSVIDRGGIATYSVYRSVNGGPWGVVTLAHPLQTSIKPSLTPGSTYTYAVRAKDLAGYWSAWKYDTIMVRSYQENSSAITYSAGWTSVHPSDAYGAYEKTSSFQSFFIIGGDGSDGCLTPDASQPVAQLKFTGQNVTLIAPLSSDGGVATVYLDGQCVGDFSLYAAARTPRQTIFSLPVDNQTSTHTLTIYAGGYGKTTIDAFIVLE